VVTTDNNDYLDDDYMNKISK